MGRPSPLRAWLHQPWINATIRAADSVRTSLMCSPNARIRYFERPDGSCVVISFVGHRATTRFPGLRLRHLCRTYNNDDPSTSNSYAPLPYITEPRRIQMEQRLSALAPILASAVVGAWTTLVNSLRMLITIDVRTYQPEKYYTVSYTHLTLPTKRIV